MILVINRHLNGPRWGPFLCQTRKSAQLCGDIFGNVEVVRDRLHIVVFFQHVDQLHQLLRGFQIDLGQRLCAPDQFGFRRLAQ